MVTLINISRVPFSSKHSFDLVGLSDYRRLLHKSTEDEKYSLWRKKSFPGSALYNTQAIACNTMQYRTIACNMTSHPFAERSFLSPLHWRWWWKGWWTWHGLARGSESRCKLWGVYSLLYGHWGAFTGHGMHVIEYGLVVGYSVVQLAGVFYPTYVHNMVYLILDIKIKVKILFSNFLNFQAFSKFYTFRLTALF